MLIITEGHIIFDENSISVGGWNQICMDISLEQDEDLIRFG